MFVPQPLGSLFIAALLVRKQCETFSIAERQSVKHCPLLDTGLADVERELLLVPQPKQELPWLLRLVAEQPQYCQELVEFAVLVHQRLLCMFIHNTYCIIQLG